MSKIRVGTRESKLALAQTQIFIDMMLCNHYDLKKEDFEIVKIKTIGDKILDRSLRDIGGKNLFTKEIENALLANQIDIAVHSLKDFTAKSTAGLMIAAYLEREDHRDAFISFKFNNIPAINPSGIIATSSIRRKTQLFQIRPDIKVMELRGNIITRIEKIKNNQEIDGAILAMAGLNRLNIDKNLYSPLDENLFKPAPGQGIICVQIRENDMQNLAIVREVNHTETEYCALAERGFSEALEANCNNAIAANAKIVNNKVVLSAEIFDSNMQKFDLTESDDLHNAYNLGYRIGSLLRDNLKSK